MNSSECSCRNEFQVTEEADTLVQEATSLLRPHFRQQQAHRHAVDYLRGLISDVERKNGWQLAEHAGYPHPRGYNGFWIAIVGTTRRYGRTCASTW